MDRVPKSLILPMSDIVRPGSAILCNQLASLNPDKKVAAKIIPAILHCSLNTDYEFSDWLNCTELTAESEFLGEFFKCLDGFCKQITVIPIDHRSWSPLVKTVIKLTGPNILDKEKFVPIVKIFQAGLTSPNHNVRHITWSHWLYLIQKTLTILQTATYIPLIMKLLVLPLNKVAHQLISETRELILLKIEIIREFLKLCAPLNFDASYRIIETSLKLFYGNHISNLTYSSEVCTKITEVYLDMLKYSESSSCTMLLTNCVDKVMASLLQSLDASPERDQLLTNVWRLTCVHFKDVRCPTLFLDTIKSEMDTLYSRFSPLLSSSPPASPGSTVNRDFIPMKMLATLDLCREATVPRTVDSSPAGDTMSESVQSTRTTSDLGLDSSKRTLDPALLVEMVQIYLDTHEVTKYHLLLFPLLVHGDVTAAENRLVLTLLVQLKNKIPTEYVTVKLFKACLDTMEQSYGSSHSLHTGVLLPEVWMFLIGYYTELSGDDVIKVNDALSSAHEYGEHDYSTAHRVLLFPIAAKIKWSEKLSKMWKKMFASLANTAALESAVRDSFLAEGLLSKLGALGSSSAAGPGREALVHILFLVLLNNQMSGHKEISKLAQDQLVSLVSSTDCKTTLELVVSLCISHVTSGMLLAPIVNEMGAKIGTGSSLLDLAMTTKIMKLQRDMKQFRPSVSTGLVVGSKPGASSSVVPSPRTSSRFLDKLSQQQGSSVSKVTPSSPAIVSKVTPPSKVTPNKRESSKLNTSVHEDGNTQDYVFIAPPTESVVIPLTAHQKEKLANRPDNIPALYQDLSQSSQDINSQDSMVLSHPVHKVASVASRTLDLDENASDTFIIHADISAQCAAAPSSGVEETLNEINIDNQINQQASEEEIGAVVPIRKSNKKLAAIESSVQEDLKRKSIKKASTKEAALEENTVGGDVKTNVDGMGGEEKVTTRRSSIKQNNENQQTGVGKKARDGSDGASGEETRKSRRRKDDSESDKGEEKETEKTRKSAGKLVPEATQSPVRTRKSLKENEGGRKSLKRNGEEEEKEKSKRKRVEEEPIKGGRKDVQEENEANKNEEDGGKDATEKVTGEDGNTPVDSEKLIKTPTRRLSERKCSSPFNTKDFIVDLPKRRKSEVSKDDHAKPEPVKVEVSEVRESVPEGTEDIELAKVKTVKPKEDSELSKGNPSKQVAEGKTDSEAFTMPETQPKVTRNMLRKSILKVPQQGMEILTRKSVKFNAKVLSNTMVEEKSVEEDVSVLKKEEGKRKSCLKNNSDEDKRSSTPNHSEEVNDVAADTKEEDKVMSDETKEKADTLMTENIEDVVETVNESKPTESEQSVKEDGTNRKNSSEKKVVPETEVMAVDSEAKVIVEPMKESIQEVENDKDVLKEQHEDVELVKKGIVIAEESQAVVKPELDNTKKKHNMSRVELNIRKKTIQEVYRHMHLFRGNELTIEDMADVHLNQKPLQAYEKFKSQILYNSIKFLVSENVIYAVTEVNLRSIFGPNAGIHQNNTTLGPQHCTILPNQTLGNTTYGNRTSTGDITQGCSLWNSTGVATYRQVNSDTKLENRYLIHMLIKNNDTKSFNFISNFSFILLSQPQTVRMEELNIRSLWTNQQLGDMLTWFEGLNSVNIFLVTLLCEDKHRINKKFKTHLADKLKRLAPNPEYYVKYLDYTTWTYRTVPEDFNIYEAEDTLIRIENVKFNFYIADTPVKPFRENCKVEENAEVVVMNTEADPIEREDDRKPIAEEKQEAATTVNENAKSETGEDEIIKETSEQQAADIQPAKELVPETPDKKMDTSEKDQSNSLEVIESSQETSHLEMKSPGRPANVKFIHSTPFPTKVVREDSRTTSLGSSQARDMPEGSGSESGASGSTVHSPCVARLESPRMSRIFPPRSRGTGENGATSPPPADTPARRGDQSPRKTADDRRSVMGLFAKKNCTPPHQPALGGRGAAMLGLLESGGMMRKRVTPTRLTPTHSPPTLESPKSSRRGSRMISLVKSFTPSPAEEEGHLGGEGTNNPTPSGTPKETRWRHEHPWTPNRTPSSGILRIYSSGKKKLKVNFMENPVSEELHFDSTKETLNNSRHILYTQRPDSPALVGKKLQFDPTEGETADEAGPSVRHTDKLVAVDQVDETGVNDSEATDSDVMDAVHSHKSRRRKRRSGKKSESLTGTPNATHAMEADDADAAKASEDTAEAGASTTSVEATDDAETLPVVEIDNNAETTKRIEILESQAEPQAQDNLEDEYDEEFDSLVEEIDEIMDSQEKLDKERVAQSVTMDKKEETTNENIDDGFDSAPTDNADSEDIMNPDDSESVERDGMTEPSQDVRESQTKVTPIGAKTNVLNQSISNEGTAKTVLEDTNESMRREYDTSEAGGNSETEMSASQGLDETPNTMNGSSTNLTQDTTENINETYTANTGEELEKTRDISEELGDKLVEANNSEDDLVNMPHTGEEEEEFEMKPRKRRLSGRFGFNRTDSFAQENKKVTDKEPQLLEEKTDQSVDETGYRNTKLEVNAGGTSIELKGDHIDRVTRNAQKSSESNAFIATVEPSESVEMSSSETLSEPAKRRSSRSSGVASVEQSPAKIIPATQSPAKPRPAKQTPTKQMHTAQSPAKNSPAKRSLRMQMKEMSPGKLSPAKSVPVTESPAKSTRSQQANQPRTPTKNELENSEGTTIENEGATLGNEGANTETRSLRKRTLSGEGLDSRSSMLLSRSPRKKLKAGQSDEESSPCSLPSIDVSTLLPDSELLPSSSQGQARDNSQCRLSPTPALPPSPSPLYPALVASIDPVERVLDLLCRDSIQKALVQTCFHKLDIQTVGHLASLTRIQANNLPLGKHKEESIVKALQQYASETEEQDDPLAVINQLYKELDAKLQESEALQEAVSKNQAEVAAIHQKLKRKMAAVLEGASEAKRRKL